MMNIQELTSKLHKSTDSALMENQLGYIPVIYELQKESMPNILLFKHQLRRSNSYRILKKDFIIRNINEPMFLNKDDLYMNGNIRKILCITSEGKLAKDSNINIICDERTIFINTIDPFEELKYCIVFMENVIYNDSNPVFYIYNNNFISKKIDGCTSISCNNDIVQEVLYPTNQYIEPQKINCIYKIFRENVFVFKNGLFMGNDVTRISGNLFSINNYTQEDKWFVYIIYHKDIECINNINKLQSKISLLENLSSNLPGYIEDLQGDFDFRLDPNKSYDENIHDIITYISNYNHEGLLDLYLENKTSIIEEYNGKQMINNTKDDGCFYISRRRKDKMYNYIIIYVNGLLYKYHDEIKYGITTIGIPIKDINQNDEILIQFFLDCSDNSYTTKCIKGQDNIIDYLYITNDPSNIELYSPQFEGKHLYDLVVDEKRPLKVEYTYEIRDNKMNIQLENPFLYDKDLQVVNKRQYKYQKVQIPILNRNQLKYTLYDISTFDINTQITNDIFDSLFINYPSTTGNISITQLDNINIQSMHSIQLDGYIWIDKECEYTFSIRSNNGSRLYLDDKLIINNISGEIVDSLDKSNKKSNIYLDRGFHKIKIQYVSYSTVQLFEIGFKETNNNIYETISGNLLYKDLQEYYILKLDEINFKYCLNFGHYIMFNNQRRLYDNEAYVKLHGIDQVYDQSYIFISKPIPEGDYIDIFYVPDIIQEVYRESKLSEDGYITINKDDMMNTLHPELCSIFVNGRLINPSKITSINTNTIKIKEDINTLGAVSVLKLNMYDKYVDSIFEYSNDIWTQVTNTLPKNILDDYVGNFEDIINNEPDYFKPECVDLIWAIIKNFWIDRFGIIDAEKLFQYNDDPRILKRTKTIHNYIESIEYNIDPNIEYKYIDGDYDKYYKFTCINPSTLMIGKFENLNIENKYSLSMSASTYLDLNEYGNRFYCELYNETNTQRIPLYYNSDPITDIREIPKCYCLRLYLDNIPLTAELNNIRIICEFKTKDEYIKFKNSIFLEQGEYSIRNIECIPIDSEIITGVTLPYGIEFDKE